MAAAAAAGEGGETEVLLVGWAQKEGQRRKNWKRRYFVLRTAHPDEATSGYTHTLLYYKTREDAEGVRQAYKRAAAGAVGLVRGKTTVAVQSRKVKGTPRQCLLVQTPGSPRQLFVLPEDSKAVPEWARAISTLQPPPNAAELRRQTIGDRPVLPVKIDDPDAPGDDDDEDEEGRHVAASADACVALDLDDLGMLAALSEHGQKVHPQSDTKAVLAPEEDKRVPMLRRGVTLAFLRRIVAELTAMGRGDIDCGQFLNGTHTTSSATDWKEFDRSVDAFCGKACTLHTGTSFAETCITHGFLKDPKTGAPYFGQIDTFVSYTWRGEGITLANLVTAVEETLSADPLVDDPETAACFVDVFVCAQHRGVRPGSSSCPNATDVGKFEEVVNACTRLVLYCTPLTKPKALTRVWCLYEIMSAIKRERPVSIALSASDRAELRRLLYDDFPRLIALFSTIKSKNAEATFDSDRVMVFGWIARDLGDNGFEQLDQMVAKGMREWLVGAANKMVADKIAEGSGDTAPIGKLLNECGRLLQLLARHDQAEDMFRRALTIHESADGPEHFNVAGTLTNLGNLMRDRTRLAEAVPLYQRSLSIFLALPQIGLYHSRTAGALGLLGLTLLELGQLDAALEPLNRALEVSVAVNGPKDQDTGVALDNLGQAIKLKGRSADAAALFAQALAIFEEVHGPDHPATGTTAGNLAETFRDAGDLAKAEVLYVRSLAVSEASYGPDHPRTGTTANNLGGVLRDLGKLDEAEATLRRALAIEELHHGVDGGDSATIINNIAAIRRDKGDTDGSIAMYRRVCATFKATLGPQHVNTAVATSNLAGSLRDKGEYAESEQLYKAALKIMEAQLGTDHPNTIYIGANLGRTHQLSGGANAARGSATIEKALRRLMSPPFSLPTSHPWMVKLSRWAADGPAGGAPQPPAAAALLQTALGHMNALTGKGGQILGKAVRDKKHR